jgi:putative nucleotidyltransferase with HDIG domain
MDFEEAKKLVFSKLGNVNLQKHCLAVAAVMKHLARRFNQDENRWALAGILHDLDYEETLNSPERHSLVTVEWLGSYNLNPEILDAIKAHGNKAERNSLMNKAIWAADPVTGFLVACALIRPEKKLAAVEVDFAVKRMKEKRFAAGANRDQIRSCSEMGLGLEEFMGTSINAMKEIAGELGL